WIDTRRRSAHPEDDQRDAGDNDGEPGEPPQQAAQRREGRVSMAAHIREDAGVRRTSASNDVVARVGPSPEGEAAPPSRSPQYVSVVMALHGVVLVVAHRSCSGVKPPSS